METQGRKPKEEEPIMSGAKTTVCYTNYIQTWHSAFITALTFENTGSKCYQIVFSRYNQINLKNAIID